jgi:mRNA interferase MazF
MTLQCGEVVVIRARFNQAAGAKVRPVLVLLDTGDDDFVAAPITSHARNSKYDLTLRDWRISGLNVPSYVRIHKLTVLAKSEIVRKLAAVSETDRNSVVELLCMAFCQR